MKVEVDFMEATYKGKIEKLLNQLSPEEDMQILKLIYTVLKTFIRKRSDVK